MHPASSKLSSPPNAVARNGGAQRRDARTSTEDPRSEHSILVRASDGSALGTPSSSPTVHGLCAPIRTSQQQNQLQFEQHQARTANAKKEEQKEIFEQAYNEQRNRASHLSHNCPHRLMRALPGITAETMAEMAEKEQALAQLEELACAHTLGQIPRAHCFARLIRVICPAPQRYPS